MTNYAESLAFDVHCIDVDYIRPRLACSYLVIHQGKAAFIDCGTSLTVPRLLSALQSCDLDVTDVEYVIPTHIHLDHAGGAGVLMQKYARSTAINFTIPYMEKSSLLMKIGLLRQTMTRASI